jgi:hypothetical protein
LFFLKTIGFFMPSFPTSGPAFRGSSDRISSNKPPASSASHYTQKSRRYPAFIFTDVLSESPSGRRLNSHRRSKELKGSITCPAALKLMA